MHNFDSQLISTEELILKCRTPRAKEYIKEAVLTYKSGAYRSTIVATWVAIVFDIIDKMRDLKLGGNSIASQKIEKLENMVENHCKDGLMKFEKSILELARSELKLISEMEYEDLKRVYEDRNRCAHPSMLPGGSPYQPSPEVARAHLRNAVRHLLSREPVRGKEAIEQIIQEIKSDYFPKNIEDACSLLSSSPIANAKKSVVRNVLVIVLKELIESDLSTEKRSKRMVAIAAIKEIAGPAATREAMKSKLPELVAKTDDKNLPIVVILCGILDIVWESLGNSQDKVENYIKQSPIKSSYPFRYAVRSGALRDHVMNRFEEASIDVQTELLEAIPEGGDWRLREKHHNMIVKEFVSAGNFFKAERKGKRLSKILINTKDEIVAEALDGIDSNDQIYRSILAEPYVSAVLHEAAKSARDLSEEVDRVIQSLIEKTSLESVKSTIEKAPMGVSEDLMDRVQELGAETKVS